MFRTFEFIILDIVPYFGFRASNFINNLYSFDNNIPYVPDLLFQIGDHNRPGQRIGL